MSETSGVKSERRRVDQSWDPDRFVEQLAAGWQLGDPHAFIHHFHLAIHPDVVSKQPLSKTRVGRSALEKQFLSIFRLLPGATAEITSWAVAEPNVYVDLSLTAPGRRVFRMDTCDRFTIIDGLITERRILFDPGPLVAFVLRHPRRWPALARAR
jgi:hypothetical protein